MSYGISYRKTLGTLTGMRVAAMEYYGVPRLFDDTSLARTWADQHFGAANSKNSVPWSIVSEREATLLCKIQVEYMNHRCRDGVVDPTRLTYEQLLPLLKKIEKDLQANKIEDRRKMRSRFGIASFNFPEEKEDD